MIRFAPALALLLAACGSGGDEPQAVSSNPPASTPAPAATPAPAPAAPAPAPIAVAPVSAPQPAPIAAPSPAPAPAAPAPDFPRWTAARVLECKQSGMFPPAMRAFQVSDGVLYVDGAPSGATAWLPGVKSETGVTFQADRTGTPSSPAVAVSFDIDVALSRFTQSGKGGLVECTPPVTAWPRNSAARTLICKQGRDQVETPITMQIIGGDVYWDGVLRSTGWIDRCIGLITGGCLFSPSFGSPGMTLRDNAPSTYLVSSLAGTGIDCQEP